MNDQRTFAENSNVPSFVRVTAFSGIQGFLGNTGLGHVDLMTRFDFSRDKLGDPYSQIGLKDFCRFWEHCAQDFRQPNIGFRFGSRLGLSDIGLLGLLAENCKNLSECFAEIHQLLSIHQTQSDVVLDISGKYASLEYCVFDRELVNSVQDVELTMAMMMNALRRYTGPDWKPFEVHYSHSRKQGWHKHEIFYNAPLFYEQSRNRIIFDKSALFIPNPRRDPGLFGVLQPIAHEKLKANPRNTSLVELVRSRIARRLSDPDLSIHGIASDMAIGYRTLQRRLNEEGINFSDLLTEIRKENATRSLSQTSVSISEIAYNLGYSETSAFNRAFRKWYDSTPVEYRNRNGTLLMP